MNVVVDVSERDREEVSDAGAKLQDVRRSDRRGAKS